MRYCTQIHLLINSSTVLQILETSIVAHRSQYTHSEGLLQLFQMIPKPHIEVLLYTWEFTNPQHCLMVLLLMRVSAALGLAKELDKKHQLVSQTCLTTHITHGLLARIVELSSINSLNLQHAWLFQVDISTEVCSRCMLQWILQQPTMVRWSFNFLDTLR